MAGTPAPGGQATVQALVGRHGRLDPAMRNQPPCSGRS